MSQTIKKDDKKDEAAVAPTAPATSEQEQDTYSWSDQDLKRAVEILEANPQPLTPAMQRAKEAHEKLFGTPR